MTKELYSTLWEIYLKSASKLTKEDINQFETIIHGLKFKKNCKIRLMGDEFADRGSNDIFTMLLFKKMNNNNVAFEILLSNHGFGFMSAILTDTYNIHRAQSTSLFNLYTLINQCFLKKEDVSDFITTDYIPKVKLLSYTVDEKTNTISIYSHAPVGLENIRNITNYLDVTYQDINIFELKTTIDKINSRWQEKNTPFIVNHKKQGPLIFPYVE